MIKPVPLMKAFPKAFRQEITLINAVMPNEKWYTWSAGGPVGLKFYQLYFMCSLVRERGYERIFEFGTSLGKTALQLAANMRSTGRVYTLDLPKEIAVRDNVPMLVDRQRSTSEWADILPKAKIGSAYKGTRYERRIRQLYGNSVTYDLDKYEGMFDLVYVDGGHSYDVVVSDTWKAMRLLKKKGVIIFDDYNRVSDVERALNNLSKVYPLQYAHHGGDNRKRGKYHSSIGFVFYERK